MKFKFCSDGDCPLWALAALHALSSLPAQLFRTLLQQVVDEQDDDGIIALLKDTSFSSRDEAARLTATIRWVLKQCWRGGCPGAALVADLLVLGVPRTHANALAEAADSGRDAYVRRVQTDGLMENKVTAVTLEPGPDCTDTYTLSLTTHNAISGEQSARDLIIDKHQAKTLLEELKKARKRMEDFCQE